MCKKKCKVIFILSRYINFKKHKLPRLSGGWGGGDYLTISAWRSSLQGLSGLVLLFEITLHLGIDLQSISKRVVGWVLIKVSLSYIF